MRTSITFRKEPPPAAPEGTSATIPARGIPGKRVQTGNSRIGRYATGGLYMNKARRRAGAKPRGPAVAKTNGELDQRRIQTVDMAVQGLTFRQIGEHFGVSGETARMDYQAGLALLGKSLTPELVEQMRFEIVERERIVIRSNMANALRGDTSAASVVQRADNTIASLYGLRSARLVVSSDTAERRTPLAEAVDAYVMGVMEGSNKP